MTPSASPSMVSRVSRSSRIVARAAHSHPLMVAEKVIHTADVPVEDPNLEGVVRLVQYWTPLALDALLHALLVRVLEVASALRGKKTNGQRPCVEASPPPLLHP